VELLRASDGTTFEYANAAKRYERGLTLGQKIQDLDASVATKKFIANNWEDIRKMVRNAGTVMPNEQVPDQLKIKTK